MINKLLASSIICLKAIQTKQMFDLNSEAVVSKIESETHEGSPYSSN
jgi:hypothetical protein